MHLVEKILLSLVNGDFWQFDPVSDKNIKNIALYQTAVRVERGQSVYNDQYKRGAELFMLFKKVELIEQHRCEKEYNDWLMKLRDHKETNQLLLIGLKN